MTEHTDIADLLAVRRELPPERQAVLDEHLTRCAACAYVASVYDRQDIVLRPLTYAPPPVSLRGRVRQRVRENTARSRPWYRWPLGGLGALATTLAAAAVIVMIITSGRTAIPARASVPATLRQLVAHPGPHFPYSGTSIVSYDEWRYTGNMAPASRSYAFPHSAAVRWSIGDLLHYRVDITTQLPAIQAGTVTYVRNGERLLIYDRRTGRAGTVNLTAEDRDPIFQREFHQPAATVRLATLMNGGTWAGPYLDPTESVRQYLASLHRGAGQGPLHPPQFVRIVGRTHVLGQPVVIVDLGPLERSDYITGCSFQHPGHCLHHPTGWGIERLWITTRHPIVLAYAQRGVGAPAVTASMVTRMRMQVTSLHLGVGPTDHNLHFRPSIPVPDLDQGNGGPVISIGGSSPSSSPPAPFFLPASPRITGQASYPDVFQVAAGGLPGQVAGYDQIWSTEPAGSPVSGPYLEVQEVEALHLSFVLRRATQKMAGRCEAYVGTYRDGLRWIALQHGRVSVVASTNALSMIELVQYAGQALCEKGSS